VQKHTFIALSIPRPGREAEAEEWYDRQHIPDCLKLEGFVAAQRFRIDEQPAGVAVPAWKIMVVYEVESEDIAATMAQIAKVVRTPKMPMTDALDLSTALRFVALAASPRFQKLPL
jgi:hypothetical protein